MPNDIPINTDAESVKMNWPQVKANHDEYKNISAQLKNYFVGRVVLATPMNHGARKFTQRKAVICSAQCYDGRVILGFDWYKNDGSGDFHDYGPAWARITHPLSDKIKFTGERAKTRNQIYWESRQALKSEAQSND